MSEWDWKIILLIGLASALVGSALAPVVSAPSEPSYNECYFNDVLVEEMGINECKSFCETIGGEFIATMFYKNAYSGTCKYAGEETKDSNSYA